jgi:5-oxoprolinase (ATP-hydrolysing) subunit A
VRIDLNSDLGEAFGAWPMGQDALLMPLISSANVACGFHAGDPGTIRATIRLARKHGVAVGAHPGLPDLVGFGRREMDVTPADVEDMVLYQIGALAAISRSEGVRLQHVKAHGALYNMACRDELLAEAIAKAVVAGLDAGLPVAAEAFADRAYQPDGSLAPRSQPGAVIHDVDLVVARAVAMVTEHTVVATSGASIEFEADTLCLHGDTPGAAALATAIRRGLEDAGVTIAALTRR